MHMNYNHKYTSADLAGVVNLAWPVRVQMEDKDTPTPYKETNLKKEIMNLQRRDGNKFIEGVIPVRQGRNRGMVTVLYHNNDTNQAYVDSFAAVFPSFMFQYLRRIRKYSRECVIAIMQGFADELRMSAMDSKWDGKNFCVRTLRSLSSNNFIKEMTKLDLVEIPEELRAEMKKGTGAKGGMTFDDAAMDRVAEAMRFDNKEGCDLTGVNEGPSRVGDASQTTNGRSTNRSVTTEQVQRDLDQLRTDFGRLKQRLREISPEDPIFKETFYSDDPLEDMSLSSISTSASTELKELLKTTKKAILRLRARIGELEHGSPPPQWKRCPPFG